MPSISDIALGGYAVVGYETFIILGGEYLFDVPPGAHLISVAPVFVGVLNEALIYYKA